MAGWEGYRSDSLITTGFSINKPVGDYAGAARFHTPVSGDIFTVEKF